MLSKVVKKLGPDLHIFANSIIVFLCLVLVVAVGILLIKHEKLKMAMFYFVNQAMIASKQRYVGADATEDAQMLATTIATVPTAKPLAVDKANLETLITSLSKQTNRHILVEDMHQIILADTNSAQVGKAYTFANSQDTQTMKDDMPRRFTEKSVDYPNGIDEVVVPLKDNLGVTVGAVVMSTSTIFKDEK